GHAREQSPHPSAEPFTGMARSHKKQAGCTPWKGSPRPRKKTTPQSRTLYGRGAVPQKGRGAAPLGGAAHSREQKQPPSAVPTPANKTHTPAQAPSRAWPVPTKSRRAALPCRSEPRPRTKPTPQRGTLHGHGPFPRKASELHSPVGAGHAREPKPRTT